MHGRLGSTCGDASPQFALGISSLTEQDGLTTAMLVTVLLGLVSLPASVAQGHSAFVRHCSDLDPRHKKEDKHERLAVPILGPEQSPTPQGTFLSSWGRPAALNTIEWAGTAAMSKCCGQVEHSFRTFWSLITPTPALHS